MILVTGATGHIGNVLVRKLIELGSRVRALVLPGEDRTPLDGLDLEIYDGDVLLPGSIQDSMHGVDTVYHLAGMISIMPGTNSLLHQVNVQGTQNVLEAALNNQVRRLIYTSSIHAIKRAAHGITIDETLPFDPVYAISEYDRSKAEASLAVQAAVKRGLDAVIVCPTGVIGPYDYRLSEMGKLIFDAMKSSLLLSMEGAYDFVDVRDVAEGLILAGEHGRRGESYILSGERISIKRMIGTVCEITGRKVRLLNVPAPLIRFGAIFAPTFYRLTRMRPRLTPYALETVRSNSVISHAKAKRELGYEPRPLRQSLADTIVWFKENARLLALPRKVQSLSNPGR
jgi:dihydroflavonol-4-reductase